MSRIVAFSFALAIAAVLACTSPQPSNQSTNANTATTRTDARVGDTVWVLANTIRPDRRAQFEEFADSFYTAGLRQGSTGDSAITATFRHTRLLYPIAADSDGMFTYFFIMDPRIPGASYDIGRELTRLFSPAEAARLGGLLDSSMARPQKGWLVIQRLPRP